MICKTGYFFDERKLKSMKQLLFFKKQGRVCPRSFISIAWKQQGAFDEENTMYTYFKNFDHTIYSPQNNNFSLKVMYYIDHPDFKKGRKRNND
jgi:hypothetical protein